MPTLDLERLTDLHSRDREIVALKRALVALEQRQASAAAAASGLEARSGGLIGAPRSYRHLASLNLPGTPRQLDVTDGELLAAPQLRDVAEEGAKKVGYLVVSRLNRGEFFVHPREDTLSLAWLGPFEDAPPDFMTLQVESRHAQGPIIDFHCSIVPADLDPHALRDDLVGPLSGGCWNSAGPGDGALDVEAHPRGPAQDSGAPWAIVLASRVDHRRSIDFGWATFSNLMVCWLSRYGGLARRIV